MSEETKLPRVFKTVVTASPRRSLGQLFFLLGCILGVSLLISWGMGWLAVEKPNAVELYARVLDGRMETRRMAATEWARRLQENGAEALGPDAVETLTLGRLLNESVTKSYERDTVYLGAIASILGFSRDPALAQQNLEDFLQKISPEDLTEVQIFAFIALARMDRISDRTSGLFLVQARSADPSLRKAVVFSLGILAQKEKNAWILGALESALQDEVEDVRWNAAFALARLGNKSGASILSDLLDRADRAGRDENEVLTAATLEVFREAMKAAAVLHEPQLDEKIARLADAHPNLKLRQAAKEIQRVRQP